MVWMVIILPLIAVAGSLTSAFLAMRGADVEIADEVRHDGLAINLDPTRDQAAAALGVKATVAVSEGTLRVQLLLPPTARSPDSLFVMFSHATLGNVDQRVSLKDDGTGNGTYTGALAPLVGGHWYLEVSPPDRAWRLTGDFTGSPDNLALRPRSGP
jgi:hypothetical protein